LLRFGFCCGNLRGDHEDHHDMNFSFLNLNIMAISKLNIHLHGVGSRERLRALPSSTLGRQHMEMNMNRFLAAMAFAFALGSPALAAPAPLADTAYGVNAYAQAPRAAIHSNRSEFNRSDAVVDENGNVEADPDPNIRSQLQRENDSGF
jgi:hypothetical protein